MDTVTTLLHAPWPWYVSGPLIGLMVPLLILLGSRSFGISQNLEHICAITQPSRCRIKFFKYDWLPSTWSIIFAIGVAFGGFIGGFVFANPEPIQLSQSANNMFTQWGLTLSSNLNPTEIFSFSISNIILLIISGIFIGFGTRYASGCTSGHAITGLATFQVQSLYAVVGIFSGGLFASHFIAPFLAR